MTGIVEVSSNVPNDNTPVEWPGIVSRFQLVILAVHRNKQLILGAQPRIAADRLKRRNTSIALEELRRGLLPFKGKNGNETLTIPTAIDSVGNTAIVEQATDFRPAES